MTENSPRRAGEGVGAEGIRRAGGAERGTSAGREPSGGGQQDGQGDGESRLHGDLLFFLVGGFDPLGDVAVLDVHAVDFLEEGDGFVLAAHLVGQEPIW
jgi:hypothetical protein